MTSNEVAETGIRTADSGTLTADSGTLTKQRARERPHGRPPEQPHERPAQRRDADVRLRIIDSDVHPTVAALSEGASPDSRLSNTWLVFQASVRKHSSSAT